MTDEAVEKQLQALGQLRMGLLGTVTAVIFCFVAAYAFSTSSNQENPDPAAGTETASSND